MSDAKRRAEPDAQVASGTFVPVEQLPEETLRQLVEEFVTRDGTDYGRVERSVEEKVAQVLRQLAAGEVAIVFDPDSQTTNLVPTRELPRDVC